MATVKAKFIIKSDKLSKDEISKLIEINYNLDKEKNWIYEIYKYNSEDIKEELNLLLDILKPKRENLINLKENNNDVVYILYFDIDPNVGGLTEVSFKKEDFELLLDLGCNIQIDQLLDKNYDDTEQ